MSFISWVLLLLGLNVMSFPIRPNNDSQEIRHQINIHPVLISGIPFENCWLLFLMFSKGRNKEVGMNIYNLMS